MSLYYHIVFGLLVAEMGLFALISLPLPSKIRRPLLKAINTPFSSQPCQITIKCIMAFILILFIDSVNRTNTITSELYDFKEPASGDHQSHQPHHAPVLTGGETRSEIQSRRFYAQRNSYLTGFTLFLTYVLNRTFSLVFELLAVKEQIQIKTKEQSLSKLDAASQEQYSKLQAELKEKDEKIATLKKQASGLSADYASLDKKKA